MKDWYIRHGDKFSSPRVSAEPCSMYQFQRPIRSEHEHVPLLEWVGGGRVRTSIILEPDTHWIVFGVYSMITSAPLFSKGPFQVVLGQWSSVIATHIHIR